MSGHYESVLVIRKKLVQIKDSIDHFAYIKEEIQRIEIEIETINDCL